MAATMQAGMEEGSAEVPEECGVARFDASLGGVLSCVSSCRLSRVSGSLRLHLHHVDEAEAGRVVRRPTGRRRKGLPGHPFRKGVEVQLDARRIIVQIEDVLRSQRDGPQRAPDLGLRRSADVPEYQDTVQL